MSSHVSGSSPGAGGNYLAWLEVCGLAPHGLSGAPWRGLSETAALDSGWRAHGSKAETDRKLFPAVAANR